MWPLIVSLVAVVLTTLVSLISYLAKRAIFLELDQIKMELKDMENSKAGVDLCIATHKALNETLKEIKISLSRNSDTLQSMQIDVAVVKTKLEQGV